LRLRLSILLQKLEDFVVMLHSLLGKSLFIARVRPLGENACGQDGCDQFEIHSISLPLRFGCGYPLSSAEREGLPISTTRRC
jgi:hypothetical protein